MGKSSIRSVKAKAVLREGVLVVAPLPLLPGYATRQ